MKQSLCTISSNTEIIPGVHLIWIEAPDIATSAQPGQFVTVRCEGLILRRPFSIHQVSPFGGKDSSEGEIALLFKVVGKGTYWLSHLKTGDKIDILGPLGKGFSIPSTSRNLLLLAGGIGIAPLVFLAQYAVSQYFITLIGGASTAAQLYPQRLLPKEVQFIPVTEDGTMGQKAMVTTILPDFLPWADQVYACGPLDMYKAMAAQTSCCEQAKNLNKLSEEAHTAQDRLPEESKLKKCQVSLEVRMGCGIGACYGCTINTRKGLKRVCRDGPVFELDDIMWEEVRI